MKTLLHFITGILFFNMSVAQVAKKYVIIEQFTQASCGPCAAENPGFRTDILIPNVGKIHHIAYHTSWPGTDPMYDYNMSQSDERVNYYSVTGVPSFFVLGTDANITQEMIDNEGSQGSPIQVIVSQAVNGSNLDVKVKVTTIGTVPSGSYVVRAAIIEQDVNYGTAPGTNGEKYFPNVFKNMLPSTTGDPYTPAAQGDSVIYNYSFPIDGSWNLSEIYTTAFVQNETNQKILNSGSSLDVPAGITYGQLNITSQAFQTGAPATATTYVGTVSNTGTSSENYKIKFISSQPGSWATVFSINGTAYADSAIITLAGGASESISIQVTPDNTPGVGKYMVTMQSVDDPTTIRLVKEVNLISNNVTDLIVSNSNPRGDGNSANATSWEGRYTAGLTYASNTTYASTDEKTFTGFQAAAALSQVNNIYLNIGWTFPSFTDALVQQLTDFINNGGNLFVAGQDIGWETFDALSPYDTPNTRSFFQNYLKANYINDGGTSNSSLIAIASDPIFGTVATSTIQNYYGGANFFPDQISARTGAQNTFSYNSSGTIRYGGVKNVNTSGGKVVYLGVGVEMLSTTAGNNILKLSHDWFNGLISGVDFDAAMIDLSLGQAYPNPANDKLNIEINNIKNSAKLTVRDVHGRIVLTENVKEGYNSIDVKTFEPGLYFYTLNDGTSISKAKKFTVIK